MVSKMLYIFLFVALFLTGCAKNEFKLDFQLSEDVTENYNVTYYAADTQGGLTVQAVASVREGKCELVGATKRPTIIYLTARRSNYPLVIYAQRGEKIEITGSSPNPLEWNVEGNEINREIGKWRIENAPLLLGNERDSVNLALKDFVADNGNPAATLMMLSYFDRKADETLYSQLMASLKGEARDPQWLQIAARADQLSHYYSYPAKLESLVMRSNKEGADTLLADGKNPVLLLFWPNGYKERKEMMDSIKILRKELPDSVRIIADIYMDADSTSWRSAIRKDSIDDIKRFWAPQSLADPNVMKMKVTSLPYFLVFDKEGVQAYSGKDLGEAVNRYRQLATPD